MTTNGDDLAYPVHPESPIRDNGLTKREFFASQILAGLVSQDKPSNIEWLPEQAVKLADKLINELNKARP